MKEYKGKRVLVTGHTGFKGSWLTRILLESGAEVCGYALEPSMKPSLFELLSLSEKIHSVIGDIRDIDHLMKTVTEFKPEIVIHMAAQPLVIDSYKNPVYTYETNVMGTVHLLEAVRKCDSVRSITNVTTDKVYQNMEWVYGYREVDTLNGQDPYSNSKSCSELITGSYKKSYFDKGNIPVSTLRAGNVIGGGDFSWNRIVPDCYRAVMKKEPITIRNPNSIRPYQHVLEPLYLYLYVALKQISSPDAAGSYNIGPLDTDCKKTIDIAELYKKYNAKLQINIAEEDSSSFHEAVFLRLDCSKIRMVFGFTPVWDVDRAVRKTVEVYDVISQGGKIDDVIQSQICEYESVFKEKIIF